MVADAIAQIALQLHPVLCGAAAGAAHPFELLRQLLEERRVLRQAVDHGHRLAAASLLLHAQPGDDAIGHRLFTTDRAAALAVVLRPAAAGADFPGSGGIARARIAAIAHTSSLNRVAGL